MMDEFTHKTSLPKLNPISSISICETGSTDPGQQVGSSYHTVLKH